MFSGMLARVDYLLPSGSFVIEVLLKRSIIHKVNYDFNAVYLSCAHAHFLTTISTIPSGSSTELTKLIGILSSTLSRYEQLKWGYF